MFDLLGKARAINARWLLKRYVRIGWVSGVGQALSKGARLNDAGRDPILCVALTCSPNPKKMCEELLKLGAPVNQADKTGDTPLHVAISYDFLADKPEVVAAALLEAGADPEAKNKRGDTPLTLLAQKEWRQTGVIGVCETLIEGGARLETSGSVGKRAGELIMARLQETLNDDRARLSSEDSHEFRSFFSRIESWEIGCGISDPGPTEALEKRKARSL